MKQAEEKPNARRRFLAGLTAAGGLAAAGSALSGNASPEQAGTAVADEHEPESRGYRKTEHVSAYYRSLRD